MSGLTNIEWTEVTWNPATGCKKLSSGCKYCYAERWATMQQKRGIKQYANGFKFTLAPDRLNDPFRWKNPKLVFVNSMSDLFHEDMPVSFLKKVFVVMNSNPYHRFQILTKRVERLKQICDQLTWTPNIWVGVTVENNETKSRIDVFKTMPIRNKFISFEPLLEEISDVSLKGIDWVIVGGESGAKARSISKDWIIKLKMICETEKIPFFFKQWGKRIYNPDKSDPTLSRHNPHYSKGGCSIEGKLYRQLPSQLLWHYL